jgi:hypothetical protein
MARDSLAKRVQLARLGVEAAEELSEQMGFEGEKEAVD